MAQTVGADGFPVIVAGINGFVIVHCLEVFCSTFGAVQVGPLGTSGAPSIAIGSNGFPLVVFGNKAGELLVVACGDASCTKNGTHTLDPAATLSTNGVRPTSIAIGTDGFPLISYVLSSGAARVAHCESVNCFTGTPEITDLTNTEIGRAPKVDTSVAIGGDGLGLIAYGGNTVTVVHCEDVACTSSVAHIKCNQNFCDTSTLLVPAFDSVAITIGADGLPLVGYRSRAQEARLIHCTIVQCDGLDFPGTVVESATGVDLGGYMWVTAGANGHALMTYRDATNSLLRAAYCTDPACSTFNLTTIDTTATEFGSVVTGSDGLPFVVALNTTSKQATVFHCSNIFCVPYARNR